MPDLEALTDWLQSRFPGGSGSLNLTPVSGGQSNPTFFLTWGDRRMVLRKKPDGPILRGAHAVEREFRVMQALATTDVPVPEVLALEEDASVLGTPFYVMERLDGRVFADCALSQAAPHDRPALYFAMAETLARLHAIDPQAIGLGYYGRPGAYFERQLARWTRQWRDSDSGPIPALDRLADWLPAHLPPDDRRVAIAHGDFRMGNLMFHPTAPRVIAVLDWELSTLGHPLADLAFACIPWASTPEEYGGIRGLDRTGLNLPAPREFLNHYGPQAAALTAWHMAFALFRFAVIFVGISDRVRAGTAASADAERLWPLATAFAGHGLDFAEGRISLDVL